MRHKRSPHPIFPEFLDRSSAKNNDPKSCRKVPKSQNFVGFQNPNNGFHINGQYKEQPAMKPETSDHNSNTASVSEVSQGLNLDIKETGLNKEKQILSQDFQHSVKEESVSLLMEEDPVIKEENSVSNEGGQGPVLNEDFVKNSGITSFFTSLKQRNRSQDQLGCGESPLISSILGSCLNTKQESSQQLQTFNQNSGEIPESFSERTLDISSVERENDFPADTSGGFDDISALPYANNSPGYTATCPLCRQSLPSSAYLRQEHMWMNHVGGEESSSFSVFCQMAFSVPILLENLLHLTLPLRNPSVCVDRVAVDFESGNLNARSDINGIAYRCETCLCLFDNIFALAKHESTIHVTVFVDQVLSPPALPNPELTSETVLCCAVCCGLFRLGDMTSHLRSHTTSMSGIECNECQHYGDDEMAAGFPSGKAYRQHLLMNHAPESVDRLPEGIRVVDRFRPNFSCEWTPIVANQGALEVDRPISAQYSYPMKAVQPCSARSAVDDNIELDNQLTTRFGKYSCLKCRHQFDSIVAKVRHVNMKLCRQVSTGAVENRNGGKFEKSKIIRCGSCDKIFDTAETRRRHVRDVHELPTTEMTAEKLPREQPNLPRDFAKYRNRRQGEDRYPSVQDWFKIIARSL